MKRHHRVSSVVKSKAAEGIADRPPTALNKKARNKSHKGSALEGAGDRNHTLVLTGALTHHSAQELEVEIDRRCEEGVSGITLDLRELAHIDVIGVAVVAFRSRLCERRGYRFSLIPGSEAIQRAFEEAGVIDRLPFAAVEAAAPAAPVAEARPSLSPGLRAVG